MYSILSSWAKSLSVFLPRNFKLFFMAFLNAAFRGTFPYLLYGAPFIILGVVYEFIGAMHPYMYNYSSFKLLGIGICALLYVFMIPAIRPSVALKKCAYFRSYWLHIVVGALVLSLYMIAVSVSTFFAVISFVAAFFPLMITSLFFLFDTQDPLKFCWRSLYRGFIFVMYNYPFYLTTIIGGFLAAMPFLLINALTLPYLIHAWWIIVIFRSLLGLLTTYFMVCWLSIFYTKRASQLYNLYL